MRCSVVAPFSLNTLARCFRMPWALRLGRPASVQARLNHDAADLCDFAAPRVVVM